MVLPLIVARVVQNFLAHTRGSRFSRLHRSTVNGKATRPDGYCQFG